MKTLALLLLVGMAWQAMANGTWHGAYIGKGKVTNSCTGTSQEYVSTIARAGFDHGTYFYYGLRFADSLRVVANDVVLSRSWKAVFGYALTSGEHVSFEDCPGREFCEGQCCGIEEDSDDAAAQPSPSALEDVTLGAVESNSEGREYPIKTRVRLAFKNGEEAELSWIEPEKYKDDILLEGKIVLTSKDSDGKNNCELTWQDQLVWYDKKPEEIENTLRCIGGRCRWIDE